MPANPDAGRIVRLRDAYRAMLLIRRFEEKAGQLYGMGEIAGFCHLSIGQEAIAVGARAAMRPGDKVVASYRNHHHALAAGVDPRRLMAELTGRAAGVCGGNGGSMHVFSAEHGVIGGHGMVGAPASIGAGVAFAEAFRKTDAVACAFIGERAVAQGQAHEALGLARRHALPLVLICEDNGEEPAQDAPAALSALAQAHGVPTKRVDGMDVEAVAQAAAEAIQRCRKGEGPAILEARTLRYRGHSMANPARYRGASANAAAVRSSDPIAHVRAILEGDADVTQTLESMEAEVRATVNAAAEFALSMPLAEAS
jgi:pyruvate dehydrogenase E1 component alpha subunit